ncbi:UNKNOWN [Stylonychia lemnae]|uniref:Uncharacterized protein n=1 Tax=Stylonychia lemnae TaxID=5949 RepID=A0A078AYX8_STYLE|nr:UNKNOWN [Stylonychia lemnae]|eukprot:CDW87650.1 UNKNOWN [Stylonychia lemnae]
MSSDSDIGLAAKKDDEGKPVQISTSTVKVAATIKKVAKPITKPQPKTTATAIKASTKVSDEIMSSGDEGSVKSKVTTKSFNLSHHQHCFSRDCNGALITGNSWSKQNERKHRDAILSYKACTGSGCMNCIQGPKPKLPRVIKYYTCSQCEEDRCYDRFSAGKDKSVCFFCLDGKSCRGSIKGLEKESLKQAILDKLPQQTILQQLNDTDNDSIVASVESSSSKRQKNATTMAIFEQNHIEIDIIRRLKAIETNTKSVHINASVVQDTCHKFSKNPLIAFFSKNINAPVVDCINEVLKRVKSLDSEQMLGLLCASFALGHTSWIRATVTLSQMELTLRSQTLLECMVFNILEPYGRGLVFTVNILMNILMVSLCSQVSDDIEEYIKVISSFIIKATESYQLLVETLQASPKQMKIKFSALNILSSMLQDESYAPAIRSIKDFLVTIPVAKWKEQIELAHATSTVIDGDTIQKSLNEFIPKYGKPDPKLAADLSLAGDVRFQFFTKVVLNPPNYKQFAVAQYCIGLLKTYHRQMWCVPSGQGKGIIEHTLAVFALLLGFSKVYIIYPFKQLCDRDADEFSTYLDFVAIGDNELAIFDEGDAIMYNDPDKFRDFVSNCLCICFTATPDDQDPRGVDIQVLKTMTFPTFYYLMNVLERIVKFNFDLELPAMPVTEKAAEVKKLSQTGPVVVHCTSTLYEELKKLDLELVEADDNVNHQILRTLGLKVNDKFRVAVALTVASIQIILEQERSNVGLLQITFKDVDLIDSKAELTYKLNSFKFLQALSRKTIQMKQINATDLTGQNKKTPAVTGKTTATMQDKNPTTGQIKTSYQGSMGRKRTNALVPQLLEQKQGSIEQTPQPLE